MFSSQDLKCKKNKVFPNFIKITTSVSNPITKKVIHNAKINWLNLEIKHKYAKQSNLELQAYELHLRISKNLQTYSFMIFEEKYFSIIQKIEYKHEHKFETVNKKLSNLITKKQQINLIKPTTIPQTFSNNILVENLLSYNFTHEEIDLLNKGLNFSIFPKNPKEDLFVDIESNLKYLDQNKKLAI